MISSHSLTDIKQKSIRGAVSYFVRTLLLQGLGLLSVLILSAYFSPVEFGIYGFVIQIIGILIFASDIGLAAALVQKKSEPSLAEYRTAFTVQQLLSWGIVLLVSMIIASGFVQEKTGSVGAWILLSLGLSFPLASLKTIPSIILERQLNFSRLIIPQLFEQVVFYGLLIVLAVQGYGASAYVYAILSRSLIGAGVMLWLQPWPLGLAWDKPALRQLLGFGAQFQLNDFLARLKDQLFFLFLGFVLPLQEFGYIQWAKNWSLYPYNLTVQNVMAVTFPAYSRLQNHPQALAKAIEKSLFFIALGIFPLLAGMVLFIQPIIQVFPVYSKWQPAVASFILFTLSVGWSALTTPLTNALNATGHISTTLKLMVMWTGLTWLLTPVFLWWLGYNGVAWATLIVCGSSVVVIWYVKRLIQLNVFEQIWRQLAAVLVMTGVVLAGFTWWNQGIIQLFFGMIAAAVAYAAVLVLVGKNKLWQEISSLRMNQ